MLPRRLIFELTLILSRVLKQVIDGIDLLIVNASFSLGSHLDIVVELEGLPRCVHVDEVEDRCITQVNQRWYCASGGWIRMK
jgi:hypothetical protein